MKGKHFIFIALILACAYNAHAQVQSFPLDASLNSIVRSLGDQSTLMYTEDASGTAWFVLHHDGYGVAQAFQLPSGIRVRDLRIWGDSLACFCGTGQLGSSVYGLVGMFNINDVFNGVAPVNYGLIDWMGSDIHPHDLKRLDLFKCASDSLCMAMIGNAEFYKYAPVNTTTVVSAYFDGASWKICSMVRKPSETRFTDIACLENVIVAAASGTSGQGCSIKAFWPVFGFPAHPVSPQTLTSIDFGSPVGDVLVTQERGNTAIVAHYDTTSGTSSVFHRVGFTSSSGLPIAPFDTWVTSPSSTVAYSTSWTMFDLESDGDTVSLLQHAAYPVSLSSSVNDWIVRAILPPASGASASLRLLDYGTQQSLDLDVHTRLPHTSGCTPFLVTQGAAWSRDCSETTRFSLGYTVAAKGSEEISEYSVTASVANYPISPTITVIPVQIICE